MKTKPSLESAGQCTVMANKKTPPLSILQERGIQERKATQNDAV